MASYVSVGDFNLNARYKIVDILGWEGKKARKVEIDFSSLFYLMKLRVEVIIDRGIVRNNVEFIKDK